MKKTLALTLALAGVAFASQATSILSDSFSYLNGNLVGASGSPWANHSGTTPILVVNGKAQLTGSNSEDASALLTGQPYNTTNNPTVGYLYSSLSVTVSNLPGTDGTYITHFKDSGTFNFRCRVYLLVRGAAVGKFRFGISSTNSATTTTGFASWATDSDLGTNYTVVTRYNITNGESVLWINPTTEASLAITNVPPNPDSIIQIAAYAMRQASGEGTSYIDNLKLGTAFGDVAGANTAPAISGIPNESIARNGSTGALPFTVGDAESDPATLTVTRASTNSTLVPVSNIVIVNGDGTNRTVTVTPASGEQGKTLITLTVSDGVNTADSAFVVTVGTPNISAIPNQIAAVNAGIPPIAFTVTDPEGDTLTPTVSSSNTNLLKSENITINGTGSSRTLTLVPEANTNGVTTVRLNFSDGFTTTTRSFALTLAPALGVLLQDQFTYTSFNFSPNSLYDGVGSPWLTVSGSAYQVQVTNGWAYLSYTNSEDVAALLTNGPFASNLGVVFYTSFTLRETVVPSATGNYFAHLKDSATGNTFRSKIFAATNGAASGSYRIGIANQANTGTYFPLDCSLDTDYFVVARYNSGTGEAVLWVNPASQASQSTAATDSAITSPIGAYGLREDTGIGNLQISNLVVSTSFPNIPVSVTAPITITGISVSGGTVTVNFDAGDSDAPAAFDLASAGTITGAYAALSATITRPSTGKFQATAATSGDVQFYMIKRK